MRKQHQNGNNHQTETKVNSQLPDIDHAKTAVLKTLKDYGHLKNSVAPARRGRSACSEEL